MACQQQYLGSATVQTGQSFQTPVMALPQTLQVIQAAPQQQFVQQQCLQQQYMFQTNPVQSQYYNFNRSVHVQPSERTFDPLDIVLGRCYYYKALPLQAYIDAAVWMRSRHWACEKLLQQQQAYLKVGLLIKN